MECAQKKITEKITEKKADYVIALKENHPILFNEVSTFFKSSYVNEFINTKFQYRMSEEKSHGSKKKREYWLVSDIDWISQRDEWSKLAWFVVRLQ
jgi:predicted transposase YbfD/YdcC